MAFRQRLLVVGSGGQPFREYALRAMSRRADLVLVNPVEATWQKPYLAGAHTADPADPEAVAAIARDARVDGLLTYDESLTGVVADAAARIGVAHTDPAAIRRCKDKASLRALLDEAGLGPVGHGVAHTADEAVAVAARIGYPVVAKPPALGGSIGVMRADDEAQLRAAFRTAEGAAAADGTRSRLPGVLIEEYLDGPEFSVDCVVHDGEAVPLVVAEKEIAFPPYFEELAHVVPAAPHPGLDDAVRLVVAAHRAAGLDRLVTHSEVKLTSRGPRIIEINVRLGGDLIPYLGELALGVDLAAAAADVAVGRAPEVTPSRSGYASVLMVYPTRACRLERVRLRRPHAEYAGLDQFTDFLPPGTEVRLPPEAFMGRIAFAVVTGATREECLANRAAVAADVVIDEAPPAAA